VGCAPEPTQGVLLVMFGLTQTDATIIAEATIIAAIINGVCALLSTRAGQRWLAQLFKVLTFLSMLIFFILLLISWMNMNSQPPISPQTPEPTLSPTSSPKIGPLTFCMADEYDIKIRQCKVSRNRFSRPITIINYSWSGQDVSRDFKILREWYKNSSQIPIPLEKNGVTMSWDGTRWIWDDDGKEIKQHLEYSQGQGLEAGVYELRIYDINHQLLQQGSFVIE
jgi:hypothetical protein